MLCYLLYSLHYPCVELTVCAMLQLGSRCCRHRWTEAWETEGFSFIRVWNFEGRRHCWRTHQKIYAQPHRTWCCWYIFICIFIFLNTKQIILCLFVYVHISWTHYFRMVAVNVGPMKISGLSFEADADQEETEDTWDKIADFSDWKNNLHPTLLSVVSLVIVSCHYRLPIIWNSICV